MSRKILHEVGIYHKAMQEEKNHIEKEKKMTSTFGRLQICQEKKNAWIQHLSEKGKKKNHIKIEKTACSFGRPGICKKK